MSSLAQGQADTTFILDEISRGFRLIYSNPDSARIIVTKAKEQSEKINFHYGHMKSINVLGIAEDITGNYEAALDLYREARALADKHHRMKFKAQVGNNMGLVFWNRQQWDSALTYYQQSEKIFREMNITRSLPNVLNNLGLISEDMNHHDIAEDYFREAKKKYLEIGDTFGLGAVALNMSLTFMSRELVDSALLYSTEAIPYTTAVNDLSGLSKAYNNLGMIYGRKGISDSTLVYYRKALALKYKLHDYLGVSSVANNLSSAFQIRAMYDSCLYYANLGIEVCEEHELPRTIWKLYYNKAKGHVGEGDYVSAYSALDSCRSMYLDFFQTESKKQLQQLQVLHELDKKESSIKRLEQENRISELELEQQRLQLISLGGGALLVILLAIGWIFNSRKIQRHRLASARLEEKQRGLEAILEATEEERKRIGKDLHDGIGQQIMALKQGWNRARKSIEGGEEIKKSEWESYGELIENTAIEIRNISHQMAPRVLEEKGLVPAIEHMLALGVPKEMDSNFEYFNLKEKYPKNIQITVYRSIQELLKNCIKHAHASEFSIQLLDTQGSLVLHATDNGIGIDMDNGTTTGLGVQGIIARAETIGGSAKFTSEEGQGTHVVLKFPVS